MTLVGEKFGDLIGKGADAAAIAILVGCTAPVAMSLLAFGIAGLSIASYLTDRGKEQTDKERDEEIRDILADIQARAERGDETAFLATDREAHRVAFEKLAKDEAIPVADLDPKDLRRPYFILQRWLKLQSDASASRDHGLAAKIDALAAALSIPRIAKWHLPRKADHLFGREKEVQIVAQLLVDHPVVCLIAPGGIGKTALAAAAITHHAGIEQAPRAFKDGIRYHDYYVDGTHEGVLRSILNQTGRDSQTLLSQTTIIDGRTHYPAAEAEVSTQLSIADRLLYLEGCEKALDLEALLRLRGATRILITTRDHDQGAHGKSFTVEPLPKAAAAGLIQFHWEHGELQDCRALARQLGGHALSCQRAGTQLRLDALRPAELSQKLTSRGLRLIHPRKTKNGEREHEHTAVGYLLAMDAEAVSLVNPHAKLAWAILALGALAPVPFGPIPAREERPDLASATPEMLPGLLATALDTTEDEAENILHALGTRSIAIIDCIPISHSGDMERHAHLTHALLAEYARLVDSSLPYTFSLPDEESLAAARRWIKWWKDTIDRWNKEGILPGGRTRYALLTPHLDLLPRRALAAIEHGSHRSSGAPDPLSAGFDSGRLQDELVISLIVVVGILHERNGQFLKAEPLYRLALAARERTLGPEHPDTLASFSNLAVLLESKGDLAGAEPLYRRALEARERTLSPEHQDIFLSLNNLAYLLQSKGDLAGAEPLYRRALEGRERTLGPEHPDTLDSINNLAYLLRSKGYPAGAEPLFRRALEARERTLGPEHTATLISINNLAGLLHSEGDLAGAEPLYRRALEARERTLGPEHPDTLISVNNLAGFLQGKGDLPGAEPLYRRALEAQERTLGPEHPHTLGSVNNLAVLRYDQGRLEEAVELMLRAVAGRERMLGAGHPDTLKTKESLEFLREALEKVGGRK